MSTVPNAPAGRYVPAINPTLNGNTVHPTPNEPNQAAPAAINPTLESGTQVSGVAAAPLTQLPATTSAIINWTPNTGPQSAVTATTPVAVDTAGILDSDGDPVPGSGGPPYVAGNVPAGNQQVGTNVVLTHKT
jgi:hypothetical protein